jgi:apolipoprotein N-acyltransferase
MRTTLYGAKCGAALAVVPGTVIALVFYLMSFSWMDNSLIKGPALCVAVTAVVVCIGAALGAAVGGLVEGFRSIVAMRASARMHR